MGCQILKKKLDNPIQICVAVLKYTVSDSENVEKNL